MFDGVAAVGGPRREKYGFLVGYVFSHWAPSRDSRDKRVTVVLARVRFPTEYLVLKFDLIRKNKFPRALYIKGPKVFLMSSLESKYFIFFHQKMHFQIRSL